MKKNYIMSMGMLTAIGFLCAACSVNTASAPKSSSVPASQSAVDGSNANQDSTEPEKPGADGEFKIEGLKIAYTCQDLTNTYFVEVSRGVQDRCNELGIEVNIVDGKADVANQITAFENFMSKKLDGIIISPIDETALVPSVKAARDAGIPVISGNQLVEGSDAFITVPEYDYGFAIGEEAGKWIKGNLGGRQRLPSSTTRS